MGHSSLSSNLKQVSVPRLLSIPEYKGFRYKPRSIAAGLYCSYILMDDRRLFRTGKLGTETLKTPTKFKFVKKFFNGRMADDFTPLKVICKWSKLMTVTYVLFADFRKCNISKTVREKFVNKINNTWGKNNTQLLPTHDDLMAKHIWYKYLQKPGKHFPPNLGFSGKSRLNNIRENQWLNQDYKIGGSGISERTVEVRKSVGYIKTGIDWKNKKMISQETQEEEEMNSKMNYVGDAQQLKRLANGKNKSVKSNNKKKFKKKKKSNNYDEMIIIDDRDINPYDNKNKSPNRRSQKSPSRYKNRQKSPSTRSPRFSKNSSRNNSPSLNSAGHKFSERFKSPSSPNQDIKINHETRSMKKSNLKKANSRQEKSNREVTFNEERGSRVVTSQEMMKDIMRLRKKKHLTNDQKRLLQIYEQMS